MALGSVKWFDCRKGFGFIVDELGRDVFVHFTAIQCEGFRHLCDGQPVEYEPVQGPKGLSAIRVRPLAAPPAEAPGQAAPVPALA